MGNMFTLYSRGTWEAVPIGNEFMIRCQRGAMNERVALIDDSDLWIKDRMEGNAHLIAAAVNACTKVNPNNPMAVAEALSEMYEALKLYQSHQTNTSGHYCWQCAEAINKAVAKAEGKEAKP